MTEHQLAIEKILLLVPFGFPRASFPKEEFLFRLIILLLIKESGNLNGRIRSYTAIVHHLQPSYLYSKTHIAHFGIITFSQLYLVAQFFISHFAFRSFL